jgi:YHS domain-containing protein
MRKGIKMGAYTKRTARDPVCGMEVRMKSTNLISTHRGKNYYFCAESCLAAFEEDPDRYLKRKGFFGRFLDRLAKSNEKAFGSRGPSCCN